MRLTKRIIGRAAMVLILSGFYACKLNEIEYDENDSENIQNEAVASAYFDDASDMSTTTLSSANDTAGGKVIVVADNRFSCAEVTLTPDAESTLVHPRGVLSVDFGSGCTDGRGNVRSGKINIAYDGRRFVPFSSITLTFDNYTINGVQLEGKHKVSNAPKSTEENPIVNITTTDGKLTWPDGTSATREVALHREWIKKNTGEDVWHVTGSAYGINRAGKDFTVSITSKLVFKQACQNVRAKLLPSKGIEELVVDHKKKILIDFGDGSCDQQVTITINSKSTGVDLSKNP